MRKNQSKYHEIFLIKDDYNHSQFVPKHRFNVKKILHCYQSERELQYIKLQYEHDLLIENPEFDPIVFGETPNNMGYCTMVWWNGSFWTPIGRDHSEIINFLSTGKEFKFIKKEIL